MRVRSAPLTAPYVFDRRLARSRGQRPVAVHQVVVPKAWLVSRNAGGHVGDGRVTQEDGVQTFGHGQRDSGGWLADGRAIVGPVIRFAQDAVDQGELELPGAGEVGTVVDDAPLVVDDARNLGVSDGRHGQ